MTSRAVSLLRPGLVALLAFSTLQMAPRVLSGQPAQTCTPQYTITKGTDGLVPGINDIANHCDDCDTPLALPFGFELYDHSYVSVNVSSNGRLDFECANEPKGFNVPCLPAPSNTCPYDYTIFAFSHDMRTDAGPVGCLSFPGGKCGIFTSVSGTAPNRIFNIEWRAVRYANTLDTENFEVRLYESNFFPRFDVIYGALNGVVTGDTAGVQGASATGSYSQDFCNATPPAQVSRTYNYCDLLFANDFEQ